MSSFVPVKIVKISSNDTVPLIYLPKEVREMLDLEKGDRVIMYVNIDGSRLLIEKVSNMGDSEDAFLFRKDQKGSRDSGGSGE